MIRGPDGAKLGPDTRVGLINGASAVGFLPSELGLLTSITRLHIFQASSLSGTIPSEVMNLGRLWEFTIENVPLLSGTLPVGMERWNRAMRLLQIERTRLSGTLPQSLPGPCRWPFANRAIPSGTPYNTHQCHFEAKLKMCCNRLSGTLPHELRYGSGVGSTDLHGNLALSGTLPKELSHYHRVDLRGTRLSGTIPSELIASRSLWSLALPQPMVGWQANTLTHGVVFEPQTNTSFGRPRRPFKAQLTAWLAALQQQSDGLAMAQLASTADEGSTTLLPIDSQAQPTAMPAQPTALQAQPTAQRALPAECCLHACHGHGACMAGRCVCEKAWAGLDCAVEAAAASAAACKHAESGGIFIGSVGFDLVAGTPGMRTEKHDACALAPVTTLDPSTGGIYVAPDMLLLRLLNDPRHRAPSARCAGARWDPLFGFRLYSNTDREKLKWTLQGAVAGTRLLLPRALEAAPAAERGRLSQSRLPQIWEEHMDCGECGVPEGIMQPGDVVVTHWGDTACFPRGVLHVVLPPGSMGKPRLRAMPGKDVWRVVDDRMVSAARATYEDAALHRPRAPFLFFRGSTRQMRSGWIVRCYDPRSPRPARCRKVYSMGIRQAVENELGKHPMVHFNRHGPAPVAHVDGQNSTGSPRSAHQTSSAGILTGASYHAMLRTYEFCLSAPGKGFGNRLVDYIVTGCIPVVVRPGGLLLPLEPALDYDGFAVQLPFEDIPILPSILANLSRHAIWKKRQRLMEVHKMFLWDEGYGQAYEVVREQMLQILKK